MLNVLLLEKKHALFWHCRHFFIMMCYVCFRSLNIRTFTCFFMKTLAPDDIEMYYRTILEYDLHL